MRKLRLLKVIVQPVFAIDDGENLVEQVAEPVSISAAEWPGYATGQFAHAVDQLRQEVEEESPNGAGAKPNRSARRQPPKS